MEKRDIKFIVWMIVVSFVVALFLSPFASSYPDGLEKVAEKFGFIEKAEGAGVNLNFPIPDYLFPGIKNELWQTALAGFFGVLIVLAIFGIFYGIYKITSQNKSREEETTKE
ncbi:MAG: PDGLE domain-containing protein [Actinobacteria bacterium]|nr:PDGLE domain-containing protein [Actinomycetota bacterium]